MPFSGKPLIAWTIEYANKSNFVDEVIVSTDNKKIAETATKYGATVPFIRPSHLASDEIDSNSVVLHALDSLDKKFDIVMLLQPTSPLRNETDIDMALTEMYKKKVLSLVSVVEAVHPPEWIIRLNNDKIISDNLLSLRETKDNFDKAYQLNGAIYISESNEYRKNGTFFSSKTTTYEMPPERSIDIDFKIDFLLGELIIKNN